ncbi:MAG: S41 family peptidase [Thermoanaerobaculia bacterium]|nr:S41 family peptidase [Thermoanaerobaculia bacterium]
MKKSWRTLAICLFLSALVTGGLWGDRLLAVGGETRTNLRLYTEILHAAHEAYGVDVEYRELVYASIHGMLRELDPHTSFLTPEAYDSMRERQQGSFFGLGILVSMRNGQLTVISPIEGTPAWRQGLRTGDVISAIEGEPTDKMSLDEAVGKLKGPKDTQVHITIARRGVEKNLEMAITRAEIPQNTVRYAYMIEPGTGYIRLTDFSRSTGGEMAEAIDKLKSQGMKRLLLDLRNNGGGLLDQAIAVVNLFVPPETKIVETRGRTPDSEQVYFATGDGKMLDLPLVVLVNDGTASAAEILSGAIQDHDVGLVAGTPTWGKGLVQTVYNLSYGAGVALTTAKYYTPSGRLIQRDYSSYYDYYTHFQQPEAASQAVPVPSPELPNDGPSFSTDLGRKVYSGGGITPDVLLELPDGPQEVAFLFEANAFFDFAVDYQSKHAVEARDWRPDDQTLAELRAWTIAQNVATPERFDEVVKNPEAKTFILRQVHAEIFNSAFGQEAAHRVRSEGDTQMVEALRLFGESEKLLAERHRIQAARVAKLAATDGAGGSN